VTARLEVVVRAQGISLSRSTRLLHLGKYDPTGFSDERGVAKAFATVHGPVTVHLARKSPEEIRVRAWADTDDCAAIVLGAAAGLCGTLDDPSTFLPLTPDLERRFSVQKGLRFLRVPWVFDALVQIVLQQRVRFVEAARAYRGIVNRHAKRAPGPFDLSVALSAKEWLAVPPHELSALSVDRKRIDTLRHAGRLARHVEKLAGTTDFGEARRVLALFPGVGPWTTESFLAQALGDPDAVPTGDVHLPRIVCAALEPASKRLHDDARMLELLEPWRGQRGRVVSLLMSDEGKLRGL